MNIEARIEQYLAIRDKMDDMKKAHEAELAPYKEAKKLMEGMFLVWLLEHKSTSNTTDAGTVHILEKLSATIEDGDAFRKFVIANEAWHLIDWKANAPKVDEHQAANGGKLPPGIKFSRWRTTSVRRS